MFTTAAPPRLSDRQTTFPIRPSHFDSCELSTPDTTHRTPSSAQNLPLTTSMYYLYRASYSGISHCRRTSNELFVSSSTWRPHDINEILTAGKMRARVLRRTRRLTLWWYLCVW